MNKLEFSNDLIEKVNSIGIEISQKQAEQFYKETQTARGKLQYDLKSNKKIYMYYCEDYFNYCYGITDFLCEDRKTGAGTSD